MTKQHGVSSLASASSSFGKGFFKFQRKVRSSTAVSSFSMGLDHLVDGIERRSEIEARHRVLQSYERNFSN
jgi:hypothetical protein